jgi:hypothetical protein
VVVVVVMTSVLTGSGLSGGKLLSSGSLSLGVQVLDLSLTEDAVPTSKLTDSFKVFILREAHTSRCCWWGSGRHRAG